MQQLKLLLLLCLCSAFSQLQGQANEEQVTISGYIKNAETGEELLYASVLSLEESSGATTNLYGFYSLSLPKGTHTLQFSYLGYETLEKIVDLQENLALNIELLPAGVALEEVVVEGRVADQAVKETAMSRIEMDIEQIKKMPALLGEPDIIKSIQLLPGVTSAGEGSSSFFVRGGSADQNLVLIDEAPVYDVSHVFGIFSVFNADIIKSAELYKGGIPAKHGGRLSSLLEVTTA
ncbi:MAG: TonB-dependent receptor [Bacteroidota bacterium]